MSKLSRRTLVLTAPLLLSATLIAPARAAGKLVVGSYPANPPWENKDKNGEFEGFEVELVKEIGKRLGLDVEISDYGFQALFAATSSGRIDAAISSITITKERLKNQAFTQGYYDSDAALAVRKDSKIKALADTKGAAMGAISASVGEKWIKDNTEKYGFGDYKGYNTQEALLLDLEAGRIGGAIGDITGFQFAFLKMTDLTVAERISTGEEYGIMMPKGSPLLGKVNDAITVLKKEGFIASLYKKWLGVDPDPNGSSVQERPLPQA
ncbi:MAG: amino acid ABC transporter substrate-binding protein [Methylobacteriaceae bacterium]|nr:amino acid ABC transporter substrate-binding protein [Methylobacteriaceae bacterium]MBV9219445.1 amino acid ABC transporter substrate-binding protein [Methylobacteriaceae bacterium]MBV9705565.1 amino acid ABC transporter substrate-binding protein [Methylobacteriaceae bacterium]